MNTPLSLILAAIYSVLPVSLSPREEQQLLLELHTAAVCFIKDGDNPSAVVSYFYRYLDRTQISYPEPTSIVGRAMWQSAIVRATPQRCKQLINMSSDFSNI